MGVQRHRALQLSDVTCRVCVCDGLWDEELSRETETSAVDKFGSRTLQVLLEGSADAQQGQMEHVRPALGVWRCFEGRLQLAIESFDHPIGDRVVGRSAGMLCPK